MHGLAQDLRQAWRLLIRAKGFTAVAAGSLALGIAGNAVIFGLVNAMLLRPLPAADPHRLVRIGSTRNGTGFTAFSYPEYLDYRDQAAAFEGVLAHQPNSLVLNLTGEPRLTWVEIVSANYFTVLGVNATVGRVFQPEEGRAAAVLVISHRLWREQLAGDPNAIGRAVKVNGHPFTLAGVAPAGFRGAFPGFEIDAWVPVTMQAQVLPRADSLERRGDRFLMLIGRLRADVTKDAARASLKVVADRLRTSYPETNRDAGVAIADANGVHPFIATFVKAFLALLMGIVGMVLLIACANVANLLLARGAARRREMGVRLAMGASRWRLTRQLLVESVLVSLVGGLAGCALAYWATDLLSAFRPPVGVPIGLDLTVDLRVLGFTLALSMATGMLFGIAPALTASRMDLIPALRDREPSGRRRSRLRGALVVAQVAISLVLLVGAGLLARSLQNSRSIDPGFSLDGGLVMAIDFQQLGYDEPYVQTRYRDLIERTRQLPGVSRATLGLFVPLGDRGDQVEATLARAAVQAGASVRLAYNIVNPGYFEAMGIPLVHGRELDDGDSRDAPGSVVVNQTMADRFWPKQDPVGERLTVRNRTYAVVGVAKDIKYRSLGEQPPPFVYFALAQFYRPDLLLHVRTTGAPEPVAAGLRETMRALEPEAPVKVTTMAEEAAFSLVPVKLAGAVLGFAGTVGLLLAVIGIYGVVSFTVSRRVREMGIRIALGAAPSVVVRLVVRQGFALVAAGLVIGVALALAATRLLRALLSGVGPADPLTFAGVSLVLGLVGIAACYVPARRAARTDPAVVLRQE